jgi:hypothetical protein
MVQWQDIDSGRSTAKLVGRFGRHRSNPAHLHVLPPMRRPFFAAEAAEDQRVNDAEPRGEQLAPGPVLAQRQRT